MSRNTPDIRVGADSPLKIKPETKAQIKLGAAIVGKTMGDFTGDAVVEFLAKGQDMVDANHAAILAGQPIPFPIEVYAEEIARRRTV